MPTTSILNDVQYEKIEHLLKDDRLITSYIDLLKNFDNRVKANPVSYPIAPPKMTTAQMKVLVERALRAVNSVSKGQEGLDILISYSDRISRQLNRRTSSEDSVTYTPEMVHESFERLSRIFTEIEELKAQFIEMATIFVDALVSKPGRPAGVTKEDGVGLILYSWQQAINKQDTGSEVPIVKNSSMQPLIEVAFEAVGLHHPDPGIFLVHNKQAGVVRKRKARALKREGKGDRASEVSGKSEN